MENKEAKLPGALPALEAISSGDKARGSCGTQKKGERLTKAGGGFTLKATETSG